MITKSATVGFKIAGVQQQIIQLENQNAVLTPEDNQKLQHLRRTLQNLYQTYDVDLEDWVLKKAIKVNLSNVEETHKHC